MPYVFGLSDKGFKIKKLSDIKKEMEAELNAHVDPNLSFGPDTVAGVLTAVVANQAAQVWESLSGLYHSLQPDTASGRALDALCSLTGTYRKKAAHSRAKATMTLAPNAKIPKDARILTLGGRLFKVTAAIENTNEFQKDVEADLIAEETGPVMAHSGTAAKIMTPTSGWLNVLCTQTYEIGCLDETDEELRLRRINDLKATGTSTIDALRSRLGQLDQVEAVYIKEDSRSFEVIIKGGKDQDIANTIWHCKPLAVQTTGSIECLVMDSIKAPRKIRFSRPSEIPLTLHTNLKVKRLLEENELNAVKTSLVDCAKKHFSLGSEVYASRFYGSLLNHPLILDIMSLQLRDRASGHASPAEIKPEQIATLSFKDIAIEQVVEVAS